MADITICNGTRTQRALDGADLLCYKEAECSGASRAPPPKGSSSRQPLGCCGAIVNTGSGPGRVGIARCNASETFASLAKDL
jgi:hypothetical protein